MCTVGARAFLSCAVTAASAGFGNSPLRTRAEQIRLLRENAHEMSSSPFVFTGLKTGEGLPTVIEFIEDAGMLSVA